MFDSWHITYRSQCGIAEWTAKVGQAKAVTISLSTFVRLTLQANVPLPAATAGKQDAQKPAVAPYANPVFFWKVSTSLFAGSPCLSEVLTNRAGSHYLRPLILKGSHPTYYHSSPYYCTHSFSPAPSMNGGD